MNARAILTVSTTASLFGLYIVYALVMNSIIGIQTLGAVNSEALPSPKPPLESRQMAEKFLDMQGSDAWTTGSRFQVRSNGMFLYYENWEHTRWTDSDEKNAVEFSPFALISPDDNDSAYTIVCESARVKFARPFNFRNPDTGRPVAGALRGKVRINGPDGIQIEGREFYYSEDSKTMYSDQPVMFRHGRHRGKANSIQLDLDIDADAVARDEMAISGIRNIRMSQNIELELFPEDHSNLEQVIVKCAGSFDFDTETNVATFRDQVRVQSPTGERTYDYLTCDTLKLLFVEEEPTLAEIAREQEESVEDDRFQSISKNLTFERMEAASQGNPVVLVSQENNLHATMDRLLYQANSQTAVLSHPTDVQVTQNQTRLSSPEITLRHNRDGELESAVCRGAGQMQHFDEDNTRLLMDARWQREMRIEPETEPGLFQIVLTQRATVRQRVEQFGLQAESIRLWVRQLESKNTSSTSRSREKAWEGKDVIPERMLALENVRFSHPNLGGKTRRLELWFEDARPGQVTIANVSAGKPHSHQAFFGQKKTAGTTRERPPAEMEAELIQIQVIRGTELENSWVNRIVTTGKVRVEQPQDGKQQPLVMDGERVDITNQDPGNLRQIVHVYGQPARIQDSEMQLAGNELHLDRASNRAWVSGPGMMRAWVDSSLEGEPLESPEPLDIWWKEKMEFDGTTASFYDSVRTQLQQSEFLCQEMDVTLSRKIDFSREESSSQGERNKVEIAKLHCKYGVEFESRQFEQGKLKQIRQGEFGELVYDNKTGKSLATGPGTITFWREGGMSRGSFNSKNQAFANQPLQTRESQWEFVEVDFTGNVEGNLDDQTSRFQDRVQVVYGPVEKPGETIDPDHLVPNAGWMRSEALDVSMHPETETQAEWLELVASGNVELEGESFHARADQISFDESKQMYKIRSLGRNNSRIWRQKQVGGTAALQEAQAFEFVPVTNSLKVIKATIFSGFE